MTDERTRIRDTVAKTMFALSGNVCYFTGCDEVLARPEWSKVNGEIAHICGERPGAPRYDSTISAKDRNDCPNLMVRCPKHHKLIDQLEPSNFPVSVLHEMKEKHETHAVKNWATDDELARYITLLLVPVYEPVLVEREPTTVQGRATVEGGGAINAVGIVGSSSTGNRAYGRSVVNTDRVEGHAATETDSASGRQARGLGTAIEHDQAWPSA